MSNELTADQKRRALRVASGLCSRCGKSSPVDGHTQCQRCRSKVPAGAKRHRYMTDEARLWADVDRRGDDECWPWTGYRGPAGYGRFMLHGRPMGTHRASYIIRYGSVPDGLHVLHRCDNPPCCNPAHLFVGTPVDNVADMDAKGRRRPCPGEEHGMAVLTDPQVLEIWRSEGRAGDIAKRYGVTRTTVADIRNGKNWTHITGGPASYERLPARDPRKTKPETVAEIRRRRLAGESYSNIAAACGVSKRTAVVYGRSV